MISTVCSLVTFSWHHSLLDWVLCCNAVDLLAGSADTTVVQWERSSGVFVRTFSAHLYEVVRIWLALHAEYLHHLIGSHMGLRFAWILLYWMDRGCSGQVTAVCVWNGKLFSASDDCTAKHYRVTWCASIGSLELILELERLAAQSAHAVSQLRQ